LYGRSDKRYCSPTCRRDACRVRTRTIRRAGYTFVGSERKGSDSVEEALVPKLERVYGPNHRVVYEARRQAERLREEEIERLRRALSRLSLFRDVGSG